MHKELNKQMKSDVILYQGLTHRAWSAKSTINHNGWLVRLSEGVTQRANSVLPIVYNGSDLEQDVITVDKMYRKKNLPLIFQIPDYYEPYNLVEYLQGIGFQKRDETIVLTKEINQEQLLAENDSFEYTIDDFDSERWFQTLKDRSTVDEAILDAYVKIISRSLNSKITCSVMINDINVGRVLGVIEKPFIGIFGLFVDTDYRRQGIAEFITKIMLIHAYNINLKTMYLQVESENLPAIKLYEKFNFQEKFRYRYMFKENL